MAAPRRTRVGDRRDFLVLMGKSFLFIVGGILVLGGLVDLLVDGPNWQGGGALAVGLLMCLPPLAFAFRDAVREAKKGRL